MYHQAVLYGLELVRWDSMASTYVLCDEHMAEWIRRPCDGKVYRLQQIGGWHFRHMYRGDGGGCGRCRALYAERMTSIRGLCKAVQP